MRRILKRLSKVAILTVFIGLVIFLITENNIFYKKTSGERELFENLINAQDGSKLDFTIAEQNYIFEIVNSPASRILGLSGRQEIGSDGLLFVFDNKDIHNIWMKEMTFNLDLIWVADGKVVDLTYGLLAPPENVRLEQLPVYSPSVPANILIEVEEGFIEKNRIKIGSQLIFNEKKNEVIY